MFIVTWRKGTNYTICIYGKLVVNVLFHKVLMIYHIVEMKPYGALRLGCRGLRCRALTPAHWFGWHGHEWVCPNDCSGLGDSLHKHSVTVGQGTLLAKRSRQKGKEGRQSARHTASSLVAKSSTPDCCRLRSMRQYSVRFIYLSPYDRKDCGRQSLSYAGKHVAVFFDG